VKIVGILSVIREVGIFAVISFCRLQATFFLAVKYQRKQKNVKSKRQHQHHRQICQLQQKNKKYLQLQSQQHNHYIHFDITHQNI
jgi:hypothetical protein